MTVLIAIACLAVGALVCYFAVTRQSSTKVQEARRQVDDAKAEAEKQLGDARTQAEKITADAKSAAESAKREALIEAKEKIMQMRQASLNEEEQRKNEIHTLENRLVQREESLDKRNDSLDRREHQLQSYQGQLDRRKSDLDKMEEKTTTELERITGLSSDEAHDELIGKIRQQSVREEAQILRESEQRVRAKADKTAREIVSTAIQRCAADQAGEITVTSVHIPSDDLKGRIIGREGRNIRTFEQVTGVSLVIDDTPETVVLSSFDPVRRETARVTLENLIADGRIHPARIEDMYKKAETLVNERVREAGEQAAFDMGIHDLHPELIKTLGALRYRTSYGQNVLSHSVQVATLCGIMASELGMDEAPAKRAGLLHDIGKAIDHEVEGPHAAIGADLARRYGEKPEIVHAIEAHHADVEPDTVLDVLVQAADAISAARPGARRESAENYIKRLEKLEEISNAHEGVERTYAMQAGRELHVMVEPEKISDAQATVLAHDIAKQIEDEMEYPGQVRVVVIRESRAVDTAK
jgi:ribonuclease Y